MVRKTWKLRKVIDDRASVSNDQRVEPKERRRVRPVIVLRHVRNPKKRGKEKRKKKKKKKIGRLEVRNALRVSTIQIDIYTVNEQRERFKTS